MELFLEIIFLCIFAPIFAGLTPIFSVIAAHRKWHPLKNKFDKTITDATDHSFVMTADADTKSVQIVALVFASLGFAFAIAFPIILYASAQVDTVNIIIAALMFYAVMLPLFVWALHSTTKKIYFSESEIIVKSAIYLKKISFDQIVKAGETAYTRAIRALLIMYNCGKRQKTLTIKKTFGNYELARKRLLGILKQ